MLAFTPRGMYCVPGDFYIDPWAPVDLAVITHGHSDHARWGMRKYLCHHYTVPVLKTRIGPDISVQGIAYQETVTLNGVRVSLHPAGHIIGSAQVRMEYRGRVIVISGDYKIQEDGLSVPFELVKCNEFVTESTFGLPIYNWLPVQEQQEQIRQWAAANRENGRASVFAGYSLGKAQRLMKALDGIAPLFVHYSVARLNQAYEASGVPLPAYEVVDLREDVKHTARGIVIVPPSLLESRIIRKIPDSLHAVCSGWMQVRGARRWRSADAGFPISDHADWSGLLQTVKATGAEKVYVTHGRTAAFAKYLNETGIPAEEMTTEFGMEEEPEDS